MQPQQPNNAPVFLAIALACGAAFAIHRAIQRDRQDDARSARKIEEIETEIRAREDLAAEQNALASEYFGR